MFNLRLIVTLLAASLALPTTGNAAGQARHVVVVVWDGMRPDLVRPDLTPNLSRLAAEGVFFARHHAVYLSSTEVNGTALATGVHPSRSGIIANAEYRPDIEPRGPVPTENREVVQRGDRISQGRYLHVATLAETLRKAGKPTAIAGAKPVVYLHDRKPDPSGAPGALVFEGQAQPAALAATLTNRLGPFPEIDLTKTNRDNWTTTALLDVLWTNQIPPFSLLWLSEPDYSQHNTGPGSDRSLLTIRNSDRNLGRVLQALDQRGVRQQTDLLVVSDHGFSTVTNGIDVARRLAAAGFRAERSFRAPPKTNDIVVVGNGGSVLLDVIGDDSKTVEQVVRFLQTEPYTGPIFTRQGTGGTFRLADALIDAPTAPDIVFSMRWDGGTNRYGVAGYVIADAENATVLALRATFLATGNVVGSHVTLSPFDLRNTLIAAGPDFKSGLRSEVPSGNVDVAPTLLWILGVEPAQPLSGRVLSEALTIPGPPAGPPRTTRLAAEATHGDFLWRQYLDRIEVGGVTYLEQGFSERLPLPKPAP